MSRRLPSSRHREILDRLALAGTVTVEDLAASLACSRETIRRDLKALAGHDRLTIVHGGALRRGLPEAPFSDRRAENRSAKEAIAAVAVGLVSSGMSILLDSGTTTQAVAEALARSGHDRLVVHTTSFANAQALARHPGLRVHLIGGEVDPNDDATGGPEARRAVARLSLDLAFVGVGGIDADGRITDYTRASASLRGAMLGAAEHAYFLADRSKFGRRLSGPVPEDGRAAALIVDQRPVGPIADVLARRRLTVIAPEK